MSSKIDELVAKMIEKPYILEMGKGKISKWLGCTEDEVRTAKKAAKAYLRSMDDVDIAKTIKLPNILILDIETAPIKAYVWSLWKQNVSLDQIESNWFMLTWSAKWLYSAEVLSDAVTPEEVLEEDDKRIVTSLWDLLNKADIVIAHNGMAFDIPKINGRILIHGLPPTRPYQQIDTLLISRKQFGFSSNKLEALARMFGMKGKDKTEFMLWVNCLKGDPQAIIQMETYNRQDVVVLEEVYLRMRPWIKGHVNLGVYSDGSRPLCPNCGSHKVHEDGGYYFTPAGRYKTLVCECGNISRSRTSDMTKVERKNNIISIAR